jgi:hypothetical protein
MPLHQVSKLHMLQLQLPKFSNENLHKSKINNLNNLNKLI